ncbi:hypothetical protein D3C77_497170 [compost metagenome]
MSYSEIVWKEKLGEMIDTRKPEIVLTAEEFNSLAKQKLLEELQNYELPVSVNGAEFQLAGDTLLVHINGSWGRVEFGAGIHYVMEYSAGRLYLTPNAVNVRQISLSPHLLGLERVEVNPGSYLPDIAAVQDMTFHDRSMTIKLTLDWIEIARYLSSY